MTLNVECGPNSPSITDSSDSEYTLGVADTVLNYVEFSPLESTTNCLVITHQIVAEDGTSYPSGIVDEALTIDTSTNKYRVTVSDMNLQGTYKFKIKTINEGGGEFVSDVKTITVECRPSSIVGTVSDTLNHSIDL